MRNAWLFHFLVLFAAFAFCARPVHAVGTVPAVQMYTTTTGSTGSCTDAPSYAYTAFGTLTPMNGDAACQTLLAPFKCSFPTATLTYSATNLACMRNTSVYTGHYLIQNGTTCPAHSSGTSTCTCDSGYEAVNGACVIASLGPRDCAEYAQQVRDNPPPADVIFTSITPGCQGLDSGYDNGCIVNLGEYGPNSHYVLSVGGSCTAEPPAAPKCPSGQTNIGTVAIPLCTPSFSVIDPIPTSTQSEADKAALEAVAAVANSGGTAAQASAAGQAAAAAITSGGTGAQAAAAGAAAGAAVGGAVAGFGDVAGATAGARASEGFGATESTQQEVLKQLKSDSLFSSLGAVPTDDKIPTQGIAVTYNPLSFLNSPSCPSPITYSMLGISRDISYQSACDFLDNLRPLILAFATITVAIIYIRGFTPS